MISLFQRFHVAEARWAKQVETVAKQARAAATAMSVKQLHGG